MKKLNFIGLSLLFLLAFCQSASATDVSGPVSGTWTLAGSPYNVVGLINILPGQELVIEPGVQVIFQGWFKFLIYGRLQAVGTEDDSITFTAPSTAIGWHGLRFYDINTQPDSSRLVYCKITYGKSSSVNTAGDDKNGGAIFCSNSGKLRIEHCLIANNRTGDVAGANGYTGLGGTGGYPGGPGGNVTSGGGGAIYLSDSSPLIAQSIFYLNRTGNAIGGTGGIGGSWVNSGGAVASSGGPGGSANSGNGGAIFMVDSSPILQGVAMFENSTGSAFGGAGGHGGSATSNSPGWGEAYGGNGGDAAKAQTGWGGAIYAQGGEITIINCLLAENETGQGTGGTGGNGGNASVWNEGYAFAGDGGNGGNGRGGDGGAISIIAGTATISAKTLARNACGLGQGGAGGWGGVGMSQGDPGIPGQGQNGQNVLAIGVTASVQVANSIIWDNAGIAIGGNPQIIYSCVQGGYPGVGNIQSNPQFISNLAGNYLLAQYAAGQATQSPCVDAAAADSSMVIGTTRSDGVQDSSVLDMGYHYPVFIPQPVLSVLPDMLNFIALFGSGDPQDQVFLIQNAGTGQLYYNLQETLGWLSAWPMSGGPLNSFAADTITVSIQTSGLFPNTYEGAISIEAPGAIGSPDSVYISLFIGQSSLTVSNDSLNFSAAVGGSNPPSQAFTINNTGFGVLNYTIAENADWLVVSPMQGGPVPPVALETVSIVTADLPVGFYETDIIITAPFALNSPDTVHVSLLMGEAILVTNPTNLVFYSLLAGPNPSPQTFSISNSGIGYFNFSILDTSSWLSVVPSSGGPVPPARVVTIYINNSGLQVGTYQSSLLVTAPYALNSPDTVSLILNVTPGLSGALSGVLEPATYTVYGDIWIAAEDSLTIEPGATLVFNGNYKFTIYGLLRAAGTAEDSIIFKPPTPATFWQGVYFQAVASGELQYSSVTGSNASGVNFWNSSPTLQHCTISDNAAFSLSPGGGIRCVYNSNPIFYDCAIGDNHADFAGGIYITESEPTFERCLIVNNQSVQLYGQGGAAYCLQDSSVFRNCTFVGNEAEGIYSQGGGAYLLFSAAKFDNCIFTLNSVGAVYFGLGCTATVHYSDFHDNLGANFGGSVPSGLGFISTTNLNGDSCDVYHNIFLDPLFVNPDSGDYHLTENSPCIDAGDPESPLDPDSTIADMGAFFFDQYVGISEPTERFIPETFFLEGNHPNPFNPFTTITFGLPVAAWVKVEVFDISGRLVGLSGSGTTPTTGFYTAGVHEVMFDGSDLASGIYLVRFRAKPFLAGQAGEFTAVEKMVLQK